MTGDASVQPSTAPLGIGDAVGSSGGTAAWRSIPPPASLQDPIARALEAMAAFASESRQIERELRREEQAARARAEGDQIRAIRDRAASLRCAAIASGVMVGASGACFGAAFAEELRSIDAGLKAPSPTMSLLGAAGQVTLKGSDVPRSFGEASSVMREADATSAASAAGSADARADAADAAAQAYTETFLRALRVLEAVVAARNDAMLALLRF